MGFGDMDATTRSNAMWLAQVGGAVLNAVQDTLSHPTHIRQWWRENGEQVGDAMALEQGVAPKRTVVIDQRTGERLAKVVNRAKSGDEGSEIAKRDWWRIGPFS